MDPGSTVHVPVMLDEVLAGLAPRPGQIIVDGTLGGGGHTRALAAAVSPGGQIIALDRDPGALDRMGDLGGLPIRLVQANYADLPAVLAELGLPQVGGILLDLGLSSDQLADAERGFSFSAAGALDLRFDPDEGSPASELVNRWPEARLAELIQTYGEERFARRIARRIVETRRERTITTAAELAELIRRTVPRTADSRRIDPATRTFQALRIAVNDELGSLERLLAAAPACLEPGGRLAVISFHSLEDRRVKQAFRQAARWEVLTKKPLTAGPAEVTRNPRARSAKLRVAARRT